MRFKRTFSESILQPITLLFDVLDFCVSTLFNTGYMKISVRVYSWIIVSWNDWDIIFFTIWERNSHSFSEYLVTGSTLVFHWSAFVFVSRHEPAGKSTVCGVVGWNRIRWRKTYSELPLTRSNHGQYRHALGTNTLSRLCFTYDRCRASTKCWTRKLEVFVRSQRESTRAARTWGAELRNPLPLHASNSLKLAQTGAVKWKTSILPTTPHSLKRL